MMPPAISILMSVYNGAQYLPQAIQSVLNQSYDDFEFLIVDDGSSDATADILRDFAVKDSRIHILTNTVNLGLAISLNRGIQEAQASYIARMDADDICQPERFHKQITFMESHPQVGVLGSRMQVISADEKPLFEFDVPLEHSLIIWNLFFGRTFAHPSVMMRTTVIREVGGYDEKIAAAQDVDLWSRLVGYTQFANLPDRLMLYRSHEGATSIQKAALQQEMIIQTIHDLLVRLLDWEVSLDIVEPIVQVRRGQYQEFTVEEREMVITMMHDLYKVLSAQGWILQEESVMLKQRMNQQIEQLRHAPVKKQVKKGQWILRFRKRLGL